MSDPKVALVTGAAQGIGKAIIMKFAREGFDVVINDLEEKETECEALAESVRSLGRRALVCLADVSDRTAVKTMFHELVSGFGTLSVAVCNAYMSVRAPFLEQKIKDVERCLKVCQLGSFHVAQLAARVMVGSFGGDSPAAPGPAPGLVLGADIAAAASTAARQDSPEPSHEIGRSSGAGAGAGAGGSAGSSVGGGDRGAAPGAPSVAAATVPASKGKIVLISSIMGEAVIGPNSVPYAMSKAAITHMGKSIARELAPYRINVNVVLPGYTDTPGERTYASESAIASASGSMPWGRLATPEDIAKAVLFLGSDDSDYITGSVLAVDGGYLVSTSLPLPTPLG